MEGHTLFLEGQTVCLVGHTAMFGWRGCFVGMMGQTVCLVGANRLSSTIGGNREMDQLYMTSQVSNITRKTKCSHISWHVFQD